MKKSLLITILSFWGIGGAFAQNGGYVDDLYQGSTKKSKTTESSSRPSAVQAPKSSPSAQKQTPQMPVNWLPTQTTSAAASTAVAADGQSSGNHELVIGYDEALQRRLEAYKNYKEMDESYWGLMESYHKMLANKYDPDLYNVITFGNEMWVEPTYISALFDGSDPAAGVRNKEFLSPVEEQRPHVTINVGVGFGPSWGWADPWDYYYYSPWRYSYWGRPYWGPSWGWGGPYWGGGYWGPSWGWGHSWGGGHNHYSGRPVIWGNNHSGSGYRPGSGGSSGRPGYSGGYRRNENGTGVSVNNGGAGTNRRPGSTTIRPGSAGNQYNPGSSTRPAVSGGNTGGTTRPSVDRSYRRETTTTPSRQTQTRTETPRRTESTYSAPSRSSSGGGSYGGGGGGGARRR